MVKNITTIILNSFEAEKILDNNYNNLYFTIDTPPIIVKNSAILKVSNFCHIGTATTHTDNMYFFKIRGVQADNSKFYVGNKTGNYPLILTTTFNNNRSLYDENIITLTRQTINKIDLIVDTLYPYSIIRIKNSGTNYLVGQILNLSDGTNQYYIKISSIGIITGFDFITTSSINSPTQTITTSLKLISYPYPTLTTYINGSGAVLTAVFSSSGPYQIASFTINNAGIGYKVGQTFNISTTNATTIPSAVISSVGPLGEITGYSIIVSGQYSLNTVIPTVYINSTTQTQTLEIDYPFETVSNGIPNSLNFSITITIEQDEF